MSQSNEDRVSAVGPPMWPALRQSTSARIGLTRSGASLGTAESLNLQFAQAEASDAIWADLRSDEIVAALRSNGRMTVAASSRAADRMTFIRRPDLGRLLDEAARADLVRLADAATFDAAFVLADGLSALAVEHHAIPLLDRVLERLAATGWTIAPIVVATQARVALADPIGEALRARMVVILIGERPGLSASDSLGVYVTWGPRPGRTDAERNCISNVRPGGLDYDTAADRLVRLMIAARRAQRTGTKLAFDVTMVEEPGR